MEKYNKIVQGQVTEDIIEYFDQFLTEYPSKSFIDISPICTEKGEQTPNVITQVDPNIVSKIKDTYLFPAVDYIKPWYILEDIEVDSIHLINYLSEGRQLIHNHEDWEDYSWIIYLKDSDGDTIFYTYPETVRIKPERGKIVIWKSYIDHEGLESLENKRIVVGSIKEIGKKWPHKSTHGDRV
jgi:hypothetical protein